MSAWWDLPRAVVVATRRVPGLRSVYRWAFASLARRTLARIDAPPGIRATVRGLGDGDRFEAGISDVDLVALLDAGFTPAQAFEASGAFVHGVRRASFGLPVVRDVHVFTEDELSSLAAASNSLAILALAGRDPVDVDPLANSAERARGFAQDVVVYATTRAARQRVVDRSRLAPALVAHALAKVAVLEPLATGAESMKLVDAIARYEARPGGRGGSFAEVADALRSRDAVLPPLGRELATRDAPSATGVRREALRAWAEPLLAQPAIRSVAVLASSPVPERCVLAVVVDPAHRELARALTVLARHHARSPAPVAADSGSALRLEVLSPACLEAGLPIASLALEPFRRGAATVVGAPLPVARPSSARLARTLITALGITASALRERADRPLDATARQLAVHVRRGLVPTVEAFLRIGAARGGDTADDPRVAALAALARLRREALPALLATATDVTGT